MTPGVSPISGGCRGLEPSDAQIAPTSSPASSVGGPLPTTIQNWKALMCPTRLAATILLAAYLPACTSYQALADPAANLQASATPVKRVWVTLQSGARFQLNSPYLEGDSLRGVSELSRPTCVAMTDVVKVEVREVNEIKTVGLVLGSAVVAFWAVVGLLLATGQLGE